MPPTDYSRVNRFVQPGSAVTVIKKKKKGAAPTKLDQDEAERYVAPGFTPLRDDPMRLFLPLGSVALRGSNE